MFHTIIINEKLILSIQNKISNNERNLPFEEDQSVVGRTKRARTSSALHSF